MSEFILFIIMFILSFGYCSKGNFKKSEKLIKIGIISLIIWISMFIWVPFVIGFLIS